MSETLKRTPLYDRHVALGARMVPFGGWDMPVQYSGIIDEHNAVRKAAGLFDYGRLDATTDFLLGASAHGIHALLQGVEAPHDYIDNSVCMAMTSLGCDRELSIRGVAFSVSYLQSWISGEMGAVRPVWALNPSSKEVREFLAHRTKLSD